MMMTWAAEITALVLVILCILQGAHQGLLLKIYSLVKAILYLVGTAIVTLLLLVLLPVSMTGREGVAFITALVIMGVVLGVVANALKIVNHIPVVNKLNKLGGAVLGAVYSVILLWILMFLITLCQENVAWCKELVQAVEESDILRIFYEQNPLKEIMKF